MTDYSEYYEINGHHIAWGTPFNEVQQLLAADEQPRPEIQHVWAMAYFNCGSILGLASNEVTIRAPFQNRPVMQISYELAPIPAGFLEGIHAPYIKHLEKQLGKAAKKEKHDADVSRKYLSSAVVYSAKWWFGKVYVGISVYGATRQNKSGPSGACLYMHWFDEIKAAEPFRFKNQAFENLLELHIDQAVNAKKFKIEAVRGYSRAHYEMDDPYIAQKNDNLRAAQMALYVQGLYQTPKVISEKLLADEVLYYTIPALGKTFVSNKWDTVYIDITNSPVYYNEILPARGSGGRELNIGALKLSDSRKSNTLQELAGLIEKDLGITIVRGEYYDD